MITSLTLKECENRHFCVSKAAAVAKRLLSSASFLPEDACLGWQIEAGRDGVQSCFAFSTDEAKASEADMEWVFEECASVVETDAQEAAGLERFCDKGRRVYVLTSDDNTDCDIEQNLELDIGEELKDLLSAAGEDGMILRFTTGPDPGKYKGYGVILISLAEPITLRMRTTLSLFFPGAVAKEVEMKPDGQGILEWVDAAEKLPGRTSFVYLFKTFRDLIYEQAKRSRLTLESFEEEAVEKDIIEEPDEETCLQEEKHGLALLDEMIGLEDVKEQVRRFIALAKMKQAMSRGSRVPICLNAQFDGSPGTAKTTVARILSDVLYEIGLLSSNEIVEVSRADLVAGYIGQTAQLVKKVFRDAKGKLLFIDEAYSLVDDHAGGYGDECINAIVSELEKNRDNTIVIFAGYPEKMEAFFERNPGLRSRVPYKITFPDYSADEMMAIAELEAEKRGFSFDSETREKVHSFCEAVVGNTEAGNGRFCRNLVEDAVLNYAVRVYGKDETPTNAEAVLICEDVSFPELPLKQEECGRTIGFQCGNATA